MFDLERNKLKFSNAEWLLAGSPPTQDVAPVTRRLAVKTTVHMSRLYAALGRLGLSSKKSQLEKAVAPIRRVPSARALLRRELAKSLNDGTAHGAATVAQFEELSKLVCAILGQHHHELAARLQQTYLSYDPSDPPPQLADQPSAEGAAALSSALHAVLRSAGFHLCSRESEAIAVEGHFGDETVWNVPVGLDWRAIDERFVLPAHGGYDPYR